MRIYVHYSNIICIYFATYCHMLQAVRSNIGAIFQLVSANLPINADTHTHRNIEAYMYVFISIQFTFEKVKIGSTHYSIHLHTNAG